MFASNPWHSLACWCITLISAYVFTCPFSPYFSVSNILFSYKTIYPNSVWPPLTIMTPCHNSNKGPFPTKVTFSGSGWVWILGIYYWTHIYSEKKVLLWDRPRLRTLLRKAWEVFTVNSFVSQVVFTRDCALITFIFSNLTNGVIQGGTHLNKCILLMTFLAVHLCSPPTPLRGYGGKWLGSDAMLSWDCQTFILSCDWYVHDSFGFLNFEAVV